MRRSAESGEIVLAPRKEPDKWLEDAEFAFRVQFSPPENTKTPDYFFPKRTDSDY